MTEQDNRLSKLQKTILKIMFSEFSKPPEYRYAVFRNDKEEETYWLYQNFIYQDLRKKLRIRKLKLKEICQRQNIDPKYIPMRLAFHNMEENDRFLNQWDDKSLKASFSRSLKNLHHKKLIARAYKIGEKSTKLIALTKEGYNLIKKKTKITESHSPQRSIT